MHDLIRFVQRLLLLSIATIIFAGAATIEFIFYFKIPFTKDSFKTFKYFTWKRKTFEPVTLFDRAVYKMSYYKNILHWLLYIQKHQYIDKELMNEEDEN